MTLAQLRARWPASVRTVHGQQIEIVQTSGGGMPVLFLPGAQGTAEIFYKQLLAWGETRHLVSITYPALTDGRELADAVVAVADSLELPGFDLVGTSLGGYIAQCVAVHHAERVRRVVVGNSFCDPRPSQSADKLQALKRDADTIKAEALARVEASPESELKSVQLDLMGRRQDAQVLRSRMLAVQLAQAVPPLQVPDDRLLLVECDNDPLISAPMRQAIRAAHPAAAHVVIEQGGHYPYILRADAYNAALAGFLGI